MIVPQNRLLFWFALIAVPFSVLTAVVPAALPFALALGGGLGVVILADAWLGRRGLAGLGVELPPVARMSKDRPAKLPVRLRNAGLRARELRLALPFPREVRAPAEEQALTLPAGSEWSHYDWPCTPLARGRFLLEAAYVESVSPLGFWAVRARLPARSEIRVYPNLLTERRNLAALFLNRGAFGVHAQRQVGRGREFEKLREYVPGDGFDEIHWKATARRGHPITKVFQIERTQEVYVILDASRLSGRVGGWAAQQSRKGAGAQSDLPGAAGGRPLSPDGGGNSSNRQLRCEPLNRLGAPASSPALVARGSKAGEDAGAPAQGAGEDAGARASAASPRSAANVLSLDDDLGVPKVLERCVTAALVLGLAAEQQGDLFGLLTFSNRVDTFLRARNGKAHYSACRDAIYTLEPRSVNPDFDEVCSFIRLRLRRRALLVFLTALDDPVLAESFVRNLDFIRRQHLVLVNMVQPPGATPLFAAPDVAVVDDLYERLGGHLRWQKLQELGKVLQRRGVQFTVLPEERLAAQLVTQYLGVKRRQAL